MVVYLITNTVNGKRYVGQTIKGLERRWYDHVWDAARGSSYHLHNAIRKYGKESFTIEVLSSASSQEELNALEKLWILALGTFDQSVGYNMTYGGDGVVDTPASRASRSRALRGNKNRMGHSISELHKQHISQAMRGNQHGRLGKGVLRSAETKKAISEGQMGHPNYFTQGHSALSKAKIALATTGNKSKTGQKQSEATREKIRQANLRRWALKRAQFSGSS